MYLGREFLHVIPSASNLSLRQAQTLRQQNNPDYPCLKFPSEPPETITSV